MSTSYPTMSVIRQFNITDDAAKRAVWRLAGEISRYQKFMDSDGRIEFTREQFAAYAEAFLTFRTFLGDERGREIRSALEKAHTNARTWMLEDAARRR